VSGGRWCFGVSSSGALAALAIACASGGSAGGTTAGPSPDPGLGAIGADASTFGLPGPSPEDGGGFAAVSDDGAAVWVGESDAGEPPIVDSAAPPSITAPVLPCVDTTSGVYVTPTGLAPMTMAARGAVVRCAYDSALTTSAATSQLTSAGVTGVMATSGVAVYRIAYRTYRDDGVPGLSTARVYLPTVPRALPLPIIAVAHSTVGLAAGCAPSMDPSSQENVALPWAASGFPVIATDYAGLGSEGVQGYADNHDEAHSLLDSVRALRALVDPRALGDQVVLVGYSQGGGAVLAAQGLAGSYGAAGTVVGAIAFAAEYFGRLDSFQFVTNMRNPAGLTIATGISMPVVAAMRDFAFGYNVLGTAQATATFPSGMQSGMETAIETLCQTPFGGYLQGAATHVGDLFDPAFSSAFLGCVDGTSACTGLGSTFYQWMQADLVAPDPAGPPVLYFQGLADLIMPPAQEAACNIESLAAAGVPVQVCVDPPAMHTDVPQRNVGLALQWSLAKLSGAAPPSCSSSGLPACTP
jgi:predicted esterase